MGAVSLNPRTHDSVAAGHPQHRAGFAATRSSRLGGGTQGVEAEILTQRVNHLNELG
jgi:hypothetical protein